MGHIRLGALPQTRRWEQVVELIAHDGTAAVVAAAALSAAETGFAHAAEDEGLARAVWLLWPRSFVSDETGENAVEQ